MPHPSITIDLDKLEHNARTIGGLCQSHGVAVTGVTKGTAGHPDVARAMLRGGITSIGESQVEKIQQLRGAGIHTSYMFLRLPSLSEVEEVVAVADVSLNSELTVLAALSQAAQRRGRIHDVIIMIDLGDMREGVWPPDLPSFMREAVRLPGIRIIGLGTNLACFGGVVPDHTNMRHLVQLTESVERIWQHPLQWISGLNSSGLPLLAAGQMPPRINHARIGEAILLGRETTHRQPWPDTYQDVFALRAEVVELKQKPSIPVGQRSEDAFGHLDTFANHGMIAHALVNLGREEMDIRGLTPHDPGLTILGASSSYLVMDVSHRTRPLQVGDEVTFSLNYSALLGAMTSAYIAKRPLHSPVKNKS
jgi:predicted amino acid racemase